MVVGSSPVVVSQNSDFMSVSSKEFLGIQGTMDDGFTLKRARDIIRTYSTDAYLEPSRTLSVGLLYLFSQKRPW